MLNELAQEIYQWANSQGFYDDDVSRTFGDEITLMHTELSEAYEEYRNGHGYNETYYPHGPEVDGKNPAKPEGIPSELADTLIRILDTCAHHEIDIDAMVREKMAYNRTRPHKNGGKII